MTQEEKQLLLQDLCARLPYGVKCLDSRHGDSVITSIDIEDKTVYCFDFDEYVLIENIKPYLRPMSSMTEKEYEMYEYLNDNPIPGLDRERLSISLLDWLNAHHFDFRGLIEKGLAVAVTE